MKNLMKTQDIKEVDITKNEECVVDDPCILQSLEIEELAVDGICGIY